MLECFWLTSSPTAASRNNSLVIMIAMKKSNYLKHFAIVAAFSLGLSGSSDEGATQNDKNEAAVENAQSEAAPFWER